jgi:type II secretion system protein C
MKHPFWILNLGLLSLVLVTLAFIYFSSVKIPTRQSIEPTPIMPRKDLKVAINIKKIYENDLFGTYVKELPQVKQLDLIIPFPEPPAQEKIAAPQIIEPEFLDPLQITLKGIIVVGSNDSKNRAIIQDDKTKKEGTYKVGDIIQDAQLIRIFKNKIILLRLNGQQEILYLREQDAKLDSTYALLNEWNTAIKKVDENSYTINPQVFIERVKNLAQFIELINATTAYSQGKSIGLRIGQLNSDSLGATLGLQKGDVIVSINTIATGTTEDRLAIYKNILALKEDDTITVNLTRKNRSITKTYTLESFVTTDQKKETKEAPKEEKQEVSLFLKKDDKNNKQQQYAFAPTIDKMRKTDHLMMLEKGKSPTQSSS